MKFLQFSIKYFMGNKQQMNFKNFSLPDVQLKQHSGNVYQICLDSQYKKVEYGIDPKYKYDTCRLKNQKVLKQSEKIQINTIKSFKILSYNLWFQQHNIANRINALIKIIKEANADIICLQEVNNQFLQALWKNSQYLCENGELFLPAVPMFWYDTLILTKFPMTFYKIPFLSSMNRSLLMGTFQIINEKNEQVSCSINCVHLQSLNNEKLRMDQLKVIEKINKNIDLYFIAGDMNFSDNWKQDQVLQKDYIDIWKEFRAKNQVSWTMPRTLNFPEWRPDHIVVRNNKIGNQQFRKSANFKAKIQRIGVFTVPPFENQPLQKIIEDNVVRTPSDHMGLLANVSF